jgi:hypothetical protein
VFVESSNLEKIEERVARAFFEGVSSDFTYKKCSELSSKTVAVHQYSKTSFLVQIKFITEDLQQTQTQTLIIN